MGIDSFKIMTAADKTFSPKIRLDTQVQIRKFYLCKILIIFLPIYLNMCFVCSKEASHLVPTTYVLDEK